MAPVASGVSCSGHSRKVNFGSADETSTNGVGKLTAVAGTGVNGVSGRAVGVRVSFDGGFGWGQKSRSRRVGDTSAGVVVAAAGLAATAAVAVWTSVSLSCGAW
jgi:hypothetical protein